MTQFSNYDAPGWGKPPPTPDTGADPGAECIRAKVADGTVIQHRAVCTRQGCGRMMALTYDTVSGRARQDVQTGCQTHQKCITRILGPLSDFTSD